MRAAAANRQFGWGIIVARRGAKRFNVAGGQFFTQTSRESKQENGRLFLNCLINGCLADRGANRWYGNQAAVYGYGCNVSIWQLPYGCGFGDRLFLAFSK
ncbi:hypothetical protein CEXT_567081 [Caerostris extrusa]|uniref:Pectinesterase n=1 Tax=Caerostris extrusa TaxID=172846 RepID=A0AAV4N8F6_CAEEX|nr:hypothetical protein CEXT_567081 [Caerostris extrusa]